MRDLQEKLQEIYDSQGSLETVCCRQCGCCRVACPSMKYSEAVVLINRILGEWSRSDKKQFLATCVRYFFSRSLVKPCPALQGNDCRVYSNRPLNCRLYGMVPEETYKKRAAHLAEKFELPLEQVPLNTQCSFVRRKNNQPLTDAMIEAIDKGIDQLDAVLLSDNELGRMTEVNAKIEKGWNYRSLHDWALYHIFGENLLSLMTKTVLAGPEAVAAQVKEFEDLIAKMEI